ncbi:MAG TPA: TIM barrel protein [Acidimicrobiales bacterium]|nr:TIM barrel protein [Acidimicrobiales bacterium]
MSFPLGVAAVTFGSLPARECFERAAALGFDHVDLGEQALADVEADGGPPLPLPVGDVIAARGFPPDKTAIAPVQRRDESFEDVVAMLKAHPGTRLEAGPRTVAGSIAGIRALSVAVPGLRFTIDTGHVATWGEDPVEVLDLADHVQLRQAAKGRPQLYPDEGGDVDFAAVIARLRRVGYRGRLSVEYFDLPSYGWPLEDPVGHAVALAAAVRPLLGT